MQTKPHATNIQTDDTPGLEGLKSISFADKWRKELTGTPTYIAAALLGLAYAGDSIIGSLSIIVSISMAYHYIYAYVFPRFESTRQLPKLLVVFAWQSIFWMAIFILWFFIRSRFTS